MTSPQLPPHIFPQKQRHWTQCDQASFDHSRMSDSPQLFRQWKILQLLEASRSGCTVQQLMADFEVADKTIRRDLKLLQKIFDISETIVDGGIKRWRMKPLSQQLGFTYTDLISIVMSRRFLEPMAGTPFFEGHHKVLQKIKGALGENGIHYCEKMNRFLKTTGFGTSDYTQRGQMIDRLIMAMEDRKRTLVVYQSMQATEPVEQELGPQGFLWHNGSLYLIAWSSRRNEIRNYKLDRIEQVEIVDDLQYAVPDDFCLDTWQRSAFGAWHSGTTDAEVVRIRFARQSARYVQEGFWHSTQSFESQPDGSVILTMEVNDFSPVIKWILSFGRNATALEPPEFTNQINEELQQMLDAYEVSSKAPSSGVPSTTRQHEPYDNS